MARALFLWSAAILKVLIEPNERKKKKERKNELRRQVKNKMCHPPMGIRNDIKEIKRGQKSKMTIYNFFCCFDEVKLHTFIKIDRQA